MEIMEELSEVRKEFKNQISLFDNVLEEIKQAIAEDKDKLYMYGLIDGRREQIKKLINSDTTIKNENTATFKEVIDRYCQEV